MIEKLTQLAIFRAKTALLVGMLFLAFSFIWGGAVLPKLSGGGWEDPNGESARAATFLRTQLDRPDADVVALYSSKTLTVDDAAYAVAVKRTIDALPKGDVVRADTYFNTKSDGLVSTDRKQTIAVVQLRGNDDDQLEKAYLAVRDDFEADGLSVELSGQVVTRATVKERSDEDLQRAEMLSAPILLVLLVIVFRSAVAAVLPVAVGIFAVGGSLTLLRIFNGISPVSTFAMNIVSLLGLGLSVDYALFMISRFREELNHGRSANSAVARSMQAAGRTILFSGLTVAASLAGLLVFPQPFLKSMGLGGMAAVVMAMIGALVLLPATLVLLGHRINSLRLGGPFEARPMPLGASHWAHLAVRVMRQPGLFAAAAVAVLALLGAPFLQAQFQRPDTSVMPKDDEARQVMDTLSANFPMNSTKPISIAITTRAAATSTSSMNQLKTYVENLEALPGVTGTQSAASAASTSAASTSAASTAMAKTMLSHYAKGNAMRVDVFYDVPSQSKAAQQIVEMVRHTAPPAEFQVLVGGETAKLVDLVSSRNHALAPMALIIFSSIGVLLFLAFGSVTLAVKAMVMNIVSQVAAFGVVVLVFQKGHLLWLIGGTSTGAIDATQPILMLATVFGLSMDYEVFLLSRIKEAYDRTGDTTKSVAIGLARTGPIISRAALLMIVVVAAFSTSQIALLKMIGAGMAVAIAVDATIVRGLLVPAAMQLMGDVNWWSPPALKRLYERFGLDHSTPAGNNSRVPVASHQTPPARHMAPPRPTYVQQPDYGRRDPAHYTGYASGGHGAARTYAHR